MKLISILKILLWEELFAVLILMLAVTISFSLFSKIFLADWQITNGAVLKSVLNTMPGGGGTANTATPELKCWITTIQYQVNGITYSTSMQRKDIVSMLCGKNGDDPPASMVVPKKGEHVSVWYDRDKPSNAVRENTTPWGWITGFLFSITISLIFFVYLFKKINNSVRK